MDGFYPNVILARKLGIQADANSASLLDRVSSYTVVAKARRSAR